MSIISLARGRENVNIFKRKIANEKIKMSFAVSVVGGFLVIFTTMVILIENLFHNRNSDITFIQSFYEATSAFGTTGLSLFDNSRLGIVSKICLIISMFVGQLGVSTTILA